MPRYYFHIREGNVLMPDDEGRFFPGLPAARNELMASLREIVSERLLHGTDIEGRQFEIADEAGDVLAIVPFTSLLR